MLSAWSLSLIFISPMSLFVHVICFLHWRSDQGLIEYLMIFRFSALEEQPPGSRFSTYWTWAPPTCLWTFVISKYMKVDPKSFLPSSLILLAVIAIYNCQLSIILAWNGSAWCVLLLHWRRLRLCSWISSSQ